MVITEFYRLRLPDRVRLVRHYSDQGFKIERDGVLYDEAIDPEDAGRYYTEVPIRVDGWEPPADQQKQE